MLLLVKQKPHPFCSSVIEVHGYMYVVARDLATTGKAKEKQIETLTCTSSYAVESRLPVLFKLKMRKLHRASYLPSRFKPVD